MSQPDPIERVGTIAVAGGGVIGTSIAWRLAQRGWRVTLFDKSSIGGEASWAAAGMLSPGGEIERPSDLAFLATESRRLYSGFVSELEKVYSRRVIIFINFLKIFQPCLDVGLFCSILK